MTVVALGPEWLQPDSIISWLGPWALVGLALIVPYQALLTPIFFMFARVGLTNTLLGLAIVHKVVTQHEGTMSVGARAGGGAARSR